MSTPQRVVLGAWLGIVGLATVRSFAGGKGWPQPSIYLGSGVLFTMLFGASAFLGPLAAAIAVGVDVGALVAPYVRGSNTGPLDQLAAALQGISGGQPAMPGGGSSGAIAP